MNKTSISHAARKGYVWASASKAFLLVFRVGLAAVLARLITPEAFGLYGILFLLVEVSRVFISSFINLTLILEKKEEKLTTAGFAIAILHASVLAALMAAFAGPLAVFFNEEAALTPFLRVGALLLLLEAVSEPVQSLLEKRLEIKYVVLTDLAGIVLGSGLVTISLALLGWQHWALFWGFAAYTVIKIVLFVCREPIRMAWPERRHFRMIYRYSPSLILIDIANKMALKGDYFITTKFLGAQALGFYSKAYHLMEIPSGLFGRGIDQVGLPTFSTLADNRPLLKGYFLKLMYLVFILTLPLSVLLFFLGEAAVMILFGDQWGATVAPFQVLVFGMALRLGYKIPNTILKSLRSFRMVTFIQIFYAVAVVTLSYLFLDNGITGIAIAVLIALTLTNLLYIVITCRELGISAAAMGSTLLDPVIVSLLMCACFLGLQQLAGKGGYFHQIGIGAVSFGAGALFYLVKHRLSPNAYDRWFLGAVRKMLRLG